MLLRTLGQLTFLQTTVTSKAPMFYGTWYNHRNTFYLFFSCKNTDTFKLNESLCRIFTFVLVEFFAGMLTANIISSTISREINIKLFSR